MKTPYAVLTATCPRHGEVTVERKRNPKAGQRVESGGLQPPYPLSVVCPNCVLHAKVVKTEEVTA